jgi:hypothetical protein
VKSFVGEAGRSDGPVATMGGGRSSGDADMGGGVRFRGRSNTESAWKNLGSGRDLLTEDRGGDGAWCFGRVSSCLPSA